jgi:hypothetical protein
MHAFVYALLLVMAPAAPVAEDPAALPADTPGGWMLLQHFYPGPTLGRGVDHWISAGDYGDGPDAEGRIRVRLIIPTHYDEALRPTGFVDGVREIDCVRRLERLGEPGAPDEWQELPDFVPGARMIFSLCSPEEMARRERTPDLATALAYSQELERLYRTREAASRP